MNESLHACWASLFLSVPCGCFLEFGIYLDKFILDKFLYEIRKIRTGWQLCDKLTHIVKIRNIMLGVSILKKTSKRIRDLNWTLAMRLGPICLLFVGGGVAERSSSGVVRMWVRIPVCQSQYLCP